MFSSDQITTATNIIKHFNRWSKELQKNPQALLITQKSRDALVLVNARIYESLLESHYHNAIRRGENSLLLD